MPPSIWPMHRQRVERPADVLGGGDLHHLHQPELGVDVDDGAVGDEGERRVAVALAVLVEVLGRAVVVLDRLVERRRRPVASATGTRSAPIESTTSVPSTTQAQRVDAVRRADVLEQSLAHRPARGVDRPAAHPRLARRRRRAGRADRGVDRLEHAPRRRRASMRAICSAMRDEALADLGGGELQRGHAVGQPAAGRRVVVEALGVHQVLDRHARSRCRARTWPASAVRPAPPGRRIGSPSEPPTGSSGSGSAAVSRMHRATGATFSTDLAGDQPVAGPHRVAQADLDRVEAARRGQLVHLALVGEARLHHAEAAHRPARQVVGAHRVAVDDGVRALVRALGVGDGVDQHRRRRRRVGAAVEHEAGLDLDDARRRRWRGGASRSSPGGGGRGRGSSPPGCTACAPDGRCAARAGSVCTCRLMSSRAPNAPPTPPSARRTCLRARPRQAAICLRSSCSHWVATYSSTAVRRRGSGMASAASSPRNAWSCMPIS